MINSPYFDLFQNDSIDKQLKIEFDGGVITNEDFHEQQFELTESLCSESELRFGSCEASSIKFKVHNIFLPLKGKWLTVSMTLNGSKEPFLIGKYKVFSDVPTADRKYRDVVAYDAMYDIINADVSEWYNTILSNKDRKVTLKQFRTSFISYFGLEQEEMDLVNDGMVVERTIEPEEISGKNVITSICEINGCFGHIGRNGKFQWVYLPQPIQGLYPANDLYPDRVPDYLPYQQETGHLYPQDPKSTAIGKGSYISCSYEDFITKEIKKLQIRQEENDIGAIVGANGNTYIIEDNFLVYGKSSVDLETIANNILGKIKGIIYRPFESDCKGNPRFEVGDPVRLSTKYELVESYILQRTLKGIQALRDNYSSEGVLEYAEKVNSVQKSIVQLKGKTNTLTRNVEETKSRIEDVNDGLSSEISQTASQIRAEVSNAEKGLQSQITQNASSISTKVTKGTVSSEISQEAGKISIQSNRLSITSDNFSLSENGTVTATNGNFSGTVNATNGSFSGTVNATSGNFENVHISESCTVAGQSISGTVNGSYIGSGIRAGNITSGNISRPIYYSEGSSFDENGLTSRTGTSNFSDIKVAEILPIIPYAAGGANIGSSAYNEKFATIYAATFVGSVQESSSREVKDNIAPVTSEFCLSSVRNTAVSSYNYTDDLTDTSRVRQELEEEMNEYMRSRKKSKKRGDKEKIALYQRRISSLEAASQKIPAKRYGFIAEDAPEDIVSKDRKTVDLYSCIAMAYGAIQALEQKVNQLEKEMEDMKREQNLQ